MFILLLTHDMRYSDKLTQKSCTIKTFGNLLINVVMGPSIRNPSKQISQNNKLTRAKYSIPNPIDLNKLNWFPYLPVDSIRPEDKFDMSPVRPRDITAIVNKKHAMSAPGPDGIMYGFVKKLPSSHLILSTLYSKLLVSAEPPESWSSSSVHWYTKVATHRSPKISWW